MTVGELFAGVAGFGLGFEQAGARVLWQVEQDVKARAVLSARFPAVAQFDDVRTVGAHNLEPVDVLCGGFPCQDVSVAGARKGLAGERTGLFFEAARIACELQTPWVVLENVPGLLSSHRGRDFAVVVETLVERGYGVAWRVVDSRYFGVAQRRRRVFLIGCLGGRADRAAAVLFEPARRGRHSAPGGEAGARVAATLRGRSHGPGVNAPGRGGEDDENLVAAIAFDNRDGITDDVTMTLRADCHGANPMVANTVVSCYGQGSPRGDGSDNLVAAFDRFNQSVSLCAPTQSSVGPHSVYRIQAFGQYDDDGTASTLRARDYKDATDRSVASHGVRRLTPRECERLQGFPDGWTCLCPARGDTATCICPDSPRYKQMGNAVTVPVITWIARRLMAEADALRVTA
jgi:DNA (cytosine-5)-methyltransferase 1